MAGHRVPIIVVLGATGAGKSKLALELAQRFNGEIISADAMQMYKGLDIVTNKVTEEERKLVKHHMIDFLDPMTKSTVVDFRNQALPIIEDLRSKNTIPFICGGTNYYIESLLWNILVDDAHPKETTLEPVLKRIRKPESALVEDAETLRDVKVNCDTVNEENMSSLQLYAKLKELDPERADHIHPNEKRKILRSLEIFKSTGQTHGQLLKEQKELQGGNVLGGPLRFPKEDLAVLWVQCEEKILDQRCDRRVDQMIAQGLLGELNAFHKDYNKKRGKDIADYTVGIFQSIGLKEFHNYLLLSEAEQSSASGNDLLENGKELMMIATRQYARRQRKWIRQRFLRSDRPCPNIYGVDSSDPKVWDQNVFKPAEELVSAFIQKRELDQCELKPLPHTSRTYTYEESRKIHRCEICDLVLRGQLVYEQHLKGRRHQAEVRKCRPHNSSKSFQNSESRFLQLSFPRHMVPNPIWEAVKVLRKMTRLPMHEIKSALERNHIDDDGQDEEQVISFKFCPSHIDAGNDKFFDDFKKHLATLGITEVNVNFVVE